ncbi:MAG: cytochrome c, partial [Steroidobacteraceae bacterium]
MQSIKAPFLFLLLLLLTAAAHAASNFGRAYEQALARRPDIVNGEQLFATCVACHGNEGGGREDGTVPAIAGQHWQVLTKQLLDFRYFRRGDPHMANYSATEHLRGPQEISDVVAYVNSLAPRRGGGLG